LEKPSLAAFGRFTMVGVCAGIPNISSQFQTLHREEVVTMVSSFAVVTSYVFEIMSLRSSLSRAEPTAESTAREPPSSRVRRATTLNLPAALATARLLPSTRLRSTYSTPSTADLAGFYMNATHPAIRPRPRSPTTASVTTTLGTY
jgi:hypothetical protein